MSAGSLTTLRRHRQTRRALGTTAIDTTRTRARLVCIQRAGANAPRTWTSRACDCMARGPVTGDGAVRSASNSSSRASAKRACLLAPPNHLPRGPPAPPRPVPSEVNEPPCSFRTPPVGVPPARRRPLFGRAGRGGHLVVMLRRPPTSIELKAEEAEAEFEEVRREMQTRQLSQDRRVPGARRDTGPSPGRVPPEGTSTAQRIGMQ